MTRHRGPRIHLATLTALFVAGILLALAPSAVALLPAPVIPSIPGLEKARFRVVVEGTVQAAKDEDRSASSPAWSSSTRGWRRRPPTSAAEAS